ncbi:retrovirus-related pol polyprotein from transposon TNT 1-94 [Tanacetum coccineum]
MTELGRGCGLRLPQVDRRGDQPQKPEDGLRRENRPQNEGRSKPSLETQRLRDVTFQENVFPFKETTSPFTYSPIKHVQYPEFATGEYVEAHMIPTTVITPNQADTSTSNHENSADVSPQTTIEILIALATAKGWPLYQLNVNNAFLHNYVDEEIYMLPPEGYTKAKQGQNTSTHFMAVLVYVDDVLVTGDSLHEITQVKEALDQKFTIKDIEEAKYFLEIEVCRTATLSWKTKKQPTVSRSSTEAEYRSVTTTTCKLLWLSFLLKDLGITIKFPITLFCDNKSAQMLAVNPCFHDISKHVDIDCHFTREKIQDGFLQTTHIPSHLELADIMTKALNKVQHSTLVSKLVSEILHLEGRMKII